jgi:coproporphyrinogen III oxidase-like Fe-S oxidoreductase
MFKDKKYRQRSLNEIFEDIDMARKAYGHIEQVFLCDGDAISLPTKDLLTILNKIKSTFQEVREIATYAGPKSTLSKSADELQKIKNAGLSKAYLGVESGSDEVLKKTCKGVNAEQMAEAGKRLVEAGIDLYAIILLGLAGKENSLTNARETARIINEIQPNHVPAMTYMPVQGTPMYKDIEQGKFQVLTETEILIETAELVKNIEVPNLHFTSNHASNYVPIEGILPRDRERILNQIAEEIKKPSQHKMRGL